MRLSAKLAAAMAVILIVAMGLFDLHLVRREIQLYDSDLARAGRVGRAFTRVLETVWRKANDDITRGLVKRADAGVRDAGVRIEWTPLDVPAAVSLIPDDARRELPNVEVVHRVDDVAAVQTWYVPMDDGRGRTAALIYAESYHDVLSLIRTTHRDIALATLLILLAALPATLGLGYWFVGRPIQRLRALAREVGEGTVSARSGLQQRDEIGALAGEFDRMAVRLSEETERRERAVEQLRHTDRLTTVGQLASGVAHELGTPLNVVSGHAERIAEGDLERDEVARSAQVIVEQSGAMADLIRQLLSLARRTPAERELVDLRDVAVRTASALEPLAKQHRATITVEGAAGVAVVLGDPAHLQQSLTNVVVNALQATADGGPVQIAVGIEDAMPPTALGGRRPGTHAVITVSDRGPGVPEDRALHLFEPFFTTKPAGEGTGLGLPVAHGIVEDHGGWMAVQNRPEGGAEFTITLPLAQPVREAALA